ncbi:outer membrane lipoprotein carrier protein LolA [Rhodoferax sp.]|uniref:LolA family protein n=1 Tax=Rhodoferax sp. TaxID=50421 RepID=UPI001A1049F4|nr:outer membrane lipoprotein carrier protein LolA [Rhodoferax sp.]MBE0474878.1 outer membrane lipoprotein carrier protein LolA [Rhodoferax sp.]
MVFTRRNCLGVAFAGFFLPLWAADAQAGLIAKVSQRLADAPVVRGQFEQRKSIKGFRQPLISHGDFLVARQRGVVWHTREPFSATLLLTRERLISRQGDGSVSRQLESGHEAMVGLITELMFALLSVDLPLLAKRFIVEGELLGASGWRLLLTPRDSALSNWATRVELTGERQVRLVQWQDAQGDSTLIRMSDHQTAQTLSRNEEALFD